MIFGKIKTYALIALGFVTSALLVVVQFLRFARERDKRKALEVQDEVKEKATQAIIDGDKRKEKARASTNSSGDYFTK